jgi:hypothetical protein
MTQFNGVLHEGFGNRYVLIRLLLLRVNYACVQWNGAYRRRIKTAAIQNVHAL